MIRMVCPFVDVCECKVEVEDFVWDCLGIKSPCEGIRGIKNHLKRLIEDGDMQRLQKPSEWYEYFLRW